MSVLEWKNVNLFSLKYCKSIQNFPLECKFAAVCRCNQVELDNNHRCVDAFSQNSFEQCVFDKNTNLLFAIKQNRQLLEACLFHVKCDKTVGCQRATLLASSSFAANSRCTTMKAFSYDNLVYLAVGCEKGEIYLHQGVRRNAMKLQWKMIHKSFHSISGIAFKCVNKSCKMFVCTNGGVYCYSVGNEEFICNFDISFESSQMSCCTMLPCCQGEDYFVVGREDALYCFTSEGRGPCYALEGQKDFISSLGKYIIIVLRENKDISASIYVCKIVMLDLQNKVVVFLKAFEEISRLFTYSNKCYISTASKNMFVLKPFDLMTQLSILLKMNLYEMSLEAIENAFWQDEFAGKIFKKYGDFMCNRRELQLAADNYMKTIRSVEPYGIVLKLLNSRCTDRLANYLHALIIADSSNNEYCNLLEQIANQSDLTEIAENLGSQGKRLKLTQRQSREFFGSVNQADCDNFWNILLKLQNQPTVSKKEFFRFLSANKDEIRTNSRVNLLKLNMVANNPCEFIPLIIANNSDYIKLSDYMAKNTEILPDSHSLLLLVLELCLQNNDKNAIEFLQKISDRFDSVLILCNNHSYQPGITLLNQKSSRQMSLPANNIFELDSAEKSKLNIHKCIQSVSGEKLLPEKIDQLMQILAAIVEQNYSILEVLQHLFNIKSLTIRHVSKLISDEFLEKVNVSAENTRLQSLSEKIAKANTILTQYSYKSLEYKSTNCNKCKQQLKVPTVYFLCGHSFHKECLITYSTGQQQLICTLCIKPKTVKDTTAMMEEAGVVDFNADAVKHLLSFIGRCSFSELNNSHPNNEVKNEDFKYDSNLNPFD